MSGNSETRTQRAMAVLRRVMAGEEITRHQVAETMGVKPAAADRCMRALAGLPGIEHVAGVLRSDGRYVKTTPPSDLMALAAAMGLSLSRLFEGSAHGLSMRKTLQYVLNNTRRTIEHAERKFFFLEGGGEVALDDAGDTVDDVIQAVRDSLEVEFDYKHVSAPREVCRIKPLTLAVYQHQLYVVGLGDRGLYPYRLSRIASVTVTQRTFEYPSPSEYSPEQVFRDSMGVFISERFSIEEVCVALQGNWARYALTHRWHKSQNVRIDGERTLVSMRVRVCPEIEAWILSFGDEAEVISPPSLRSRIATRFRTAAQRYGGFPKPSLAAAGVKDETEDDAMNREAG